MKLIRARVTNYRAIDDSGWVRINDVTSMVGKNESGKTAFLQALRRLNPVPGSKTGFELTDYPRKGYVKYKRQHKENPAVAVTAELELSEKEMSEIDAAFGSGAVSSNQVLVKKDYANNLEWDIEIDESAIVRNVVSKANLSPEIQQHVASAETCQSLIGLLETLDIKPTPVQELLKSLNEQYQSGAGIRQQLIDNYLINRMPMFVYYDEYSNMRGRISIQDLTKRQGNDDELDDSDRTFLSLLSLVGTDLEEMDNLRNYDYLKAELEAASISISSEIFEYWNQNKQLSVNFELSQANPDDPPPLNSGTILHVRIWNNRHRVSIPFDERSKGFVWFFSFLAYFSTIEEQQDKDLVLLLDEPGLNLHALAQKDFLRFIEDRLAIRHQVIYTTHSPFMIDLDHLDRVRTVQDIEDKGTTVSDDMLSNDQETVFPLQVALGYQMAQTLFLAPHCLMVNAPSDLVYLQVFGELVTMSGHQKLDPRWVAIPVGGADNLPAFVSLLGENYVSVAVLMDVTPKNKEKMEKLNQNGFIQRANPIKWVEVAKIRTADIEDLFDASLYLRLVNESYAGELSEPITMKAITDSNPRIVQRLQAYFENEGIAGGVFDPYRPASLLMQRFGEYRAQIDSTTIERAASMFERINALLPSTGQLPPSVTNGNASGNDQGKTNGNGINHRSLAPTV